MAQEQLQPQVEDCYVYHEEKCVDAKTDILKKFQLGRQLLETATLPPTLLTPDGSQVTAWVLRWQKTAICVKHWSTVRRIMDKAQIASERLAAGVLDCAYPDGHPLLVIPLYFYEHPCRGLMTISPYGGPDLDRLMEEPELLGERSPIEWLELILDLLVCLLTAASIMHKQGLLYRDWKPANCVYDASSKIFKVIDQGLTIRDDLSNYHQACTLSYLDPIFAEVVEVQDDDGSSFTEFAFLDEEATRNAVQRAGKAMDLHLIARTALAVMLQMLPGPHRDKLYYSTGIPAAIHPDSFLTDAGWNDDQLAEYLDAVRHWNWPSYLEGVSCLNHDVKDFMLWLLHPDPSARPQSAQEALSHPCLTEAVQRHQQHMQTATADWHREVRAAKEWLADCEHLDKSVGYTYSSNSHAYSSSGYSDSIDISSNSAGDELPHGDSLDGSSSSIGSITANSTGGDGCRGSSSCSNDGCRQSIRGDDSGRHTVSHGTSTCSSRRNSSTSAATPLLLLDHVRVEAATAAVPHPVEITIRHSAASSAITTALSSSSTAAISAADKLPAASVVDESDQPATLKASLASPPGAVAGSMPAAGAASATEQVMAEEEVHTAADPPPLVTASEACLSVAAAELMNVDSVWDHSLFCGPQAPVAKEPCLKSCCGVWSKLKRGVSGSRIEASSPATDVVPGASGSSSSSSSSAAADSQQQQQRSWLSKQLKHKLQKAKRLLKSGLGLSK